MDSWFIVVLSALLIARINSEKVSASTDNQSSKCDPSECSLMKDRLETLEAAVRSIVSAMASQKKGPFAPINKILERDPALRAVFSASMSNHFSRNTTDKLAEEDRAQEKDASVQLKGSVKCSLANLLDINSSESGINPSGNIKASLGRENSLEIEWAPRSLECLKFSSGVWIRVFESGQWQPSLANSYLAIPQKCLKKRSNASFSIVLPAPSSSSSATTGKNTCHFELKDILIQCLAYTVEVIPNYQSLKGTPMLTEIVIPPMTLQNDNTTHMESLISVASRSNSLILDWEDNSGCAPQLTSFNLDIFPHGELDISAATNLSIKIPRSCLIQPTYEDNLFSVSLSISHTCPIKWTPLDVCRKYKLEMRSQYTNTWTSAPSHWEIFTAQQGMVPINFVNIWKCATGNDYLSCGNGTSYNGGDCVESYQICNGRHDCRNHIDELNCDNNQCRGGFQCGRQCIPNENVCDGKYDCLDGSDEHYDCEYSTLCYQMTANTGHFYSRLLVYPKHIIVHPDNVLLPVQKSAVLISVQANHVIWLTFEKFRTLEDHVCKVFDGPYSTSPLLLSHSGSTKPLSIRSSSNYLYVEFPSYFVESYGVSIFYSSVTSTGQPFIPGCGGYVYGDGAVSSPNYDTLNEDNANCIWFVEARESDHTILINMEGSSNNKTASSRYTTGVDIIITVYESVYDGWDTSEQVLYDNSISPLQSKFALYSISSKMMIQFKMPRVNRNNKWFSWNVSTISTNKCKENLVATTGTIRSPNYPATYPNSSDCRWNIVTAPDSKIRLLFAFFETEEGFDYIYVYDGPTMTSPMLLEKSGSVTTPFTVNSSTNQILIRFASDTDSTYPGFLAVYSTF